ncbi:MAG: hypothetical protein H6714_00220 [Myxococcales bacterium]|nr:hypothetical protein [Myxococcales bacterium]
MRSHSKSAAAIAGVVLFVTAFVTIGCGTKDAPPDAISEALIVENTFKLDATQKLVAAIEAHGCTLDPAMSFTNKLPWGGYAYMGTGGCEAVGKQVSLITYLSPDGIPYATIASVKYLTPPDAGMSGKTTSSMSIINVDEDGNVTETPWSDDDYSPLFGEMYQLMPEVIAAVEDYEAQQANSSDVDSVGAVRAALGSPNLGTTAACEACDNFLPALNAIGPNGEPVAIHGGSTNCDKDCCECQSDADICSGYYQSADRGVKTMIKSVQLLQGGMKALGLVADATAIVGIIGGFVGSGPTAGLSLAAGFVYKKIVSKIKSLIKNYAIVALLAKAGIVIEFYYSKVYQYYDLFKGPCGFENACLEISDCNVEPECSVRVALPDGTTDWSKSGTTRSSEYPGLADLALEGKTCGIVDVVECFATDENGKPWSAANCPPGAKARYAQTNIARWDTGGDPITYAQGMIPYHCPTGECTIVDSATCHFGCTETSWIFNTRAEAESALSCAHIGPIPFHY